VKTFSVLLFVTASAILAKPFTFESLKPAKAEEVNANFDYLEQGLKSKATQSGLDSLKASMPTLAQWNNLATQPQLADSLKSIRKSQEVFAKTSDLSGFARDTSISALGKKTQLGLDSLKSALTAKAEKSGTLAISADGSIPLASTNRFVYASPAGTWFYGTSSLGFQGQGGTMTSIQVKGGGLELAYNSRGVESSIFTTSGSSITFPNAVSVTGTLNAPNMIATGIKSSDVADFVFEPGYRVMPLSEIEAFTKVNRHLPEVPSASEIEANGMDVAKMNLVLLKKVEELTLHAIAQQKEIGELRESLKELQTK